MQNLLYIHGFNSSPQSQKAQETAHWLAVHHPEITLHLPALPPFPAEALAMLEGIVAGCATPPALIGSSMGGFLATVLAARHGLRAVLVNPAVYPHQLLQHNLGEQENPYTGLRYVLYAHHADELKEIERDAVPAADRLWVLLQTADETLDYRHAVQFYAGCAQDVEAGGSHAYDNYAEKLPAIFDFLKQPQGASRAVAANEQG
jgi:predicted esterase YcpF (UPF0227 family)